ncbi:MAG: FecR family protein [Verrucomicrobiales bacterium]
MDRNPPNQDELGQLLSALADAGEPGEMGDAEFARLQEILRGSREARRRYARFMAMESMVEDEIVGGGAEVSVVQNRIGRPARRAKVIGWIGAGLAAAAASVAAMIAWQPGGTVSGENIAILSGIDGAAWQGKAAFAEGQTLKAGVLDLRAGRVHLDFLNGAEVELQGPARFELVAADRAILHNGQVAAKVPEEAVGFTIDTPSATIVDLGTEFGLNVDASGESQVHVYEGEVEVWLMEGREPVRATALTTEESALVRPGKREIIAAPLPREKFIRVSRSEEPDQLALAPGYAEAIRAAAPVGYWRFESAEGGVLANEMGPGFAAQVIGTVELVGAEGNKAASFPRTPEGGAILVPDAFGALNASDYSVEFWVQPGTLTQSSLVSLISPEDNPKKPGTRARVSAVELRKPPRSLAEHVGALRFQHKRGSINIGVRPNFPPGRWRHIAAVKEAKQLASMWMASSSAAPKSKSSTTSAPGN